jgi:N-acyl-D-amino-acid deacylase
VYDGPAGARAGDVAVLGDSIVAVGDPARARPVEVDATGLRVAPAYQHAQLGHGRPARRRPLQGDIRQGVTLEVFGEGWSMGPLTDSMRAQLISQQGDLTFDVPWTTLGEYLDHVVSRGVATNVASFVGATTVRIHEVGYTNRPATPVELARMQDLVRAAMAEGALGVGSSLIYAPANYASTEELIALARAAGETGGMYISHMRDEGKGLLTATRELITIASQAGVPAEIYHLKASGRPNWGKLDTLIALIDSARAAGLRITTDMYTYPASSTGLDATMPTWVQEGGHDAWVARLKDPVVRKRLLGEMRGDAGFDNAFVNAGGADGILLVSFRTRRSSRSPGRRSPRWPGCGARRPRDGHGPRHRGRQPGQVRLLHDVGGQRPPGRSSCLHEFRLRRRLDEHRGPSCSRGPIPARTATSRACWASTSARSSC